MTDVEVITAGIVERFGWEGRRKSVDIPEPTSDTIV